VVWDGVGPVSTALSPPAAAPRHRLRTMTELGASFRELRSSTARCELRCAIRRGQVIGEHARLQARRPQRFAYSSSSTALRASSRSRKMRMRLILPSMKS
jgi:hypothetical protein